MERLAQRERETDRERERERERKREREGKRERGRKRKRGRGRGREERNCLQSLTKTQTAHTVHAPHVFPLAWWSMVHQ